MTDSQLPEGFSELEQWVDDWALPTRAERYAARLDRPFGELVRVAPQRRAHVFGKIVVQRIAGSSLPVAGQFESIVVDITVINLG